MQGKITVTNQSGNVAVVDIEGIIGVPEQWQFEQPGERVATYEKFREVVAQISSLENPEVVVNIRSAGGNVNDALLIFEALSSLGATVTTRCYGYVASAATIIAQAAGEEKREISSNSLYLIHRSQCSAEGNANDLTRSVELLTQTDERIIELYSRRSGQPSRTFEELLMENDGNGRWLSPQEVVSYGLADRITEAVPIREGADSEITNLGLPPLPRNGINSGDGKLWKTILERLGMKRSENTLQCGSGDSDNSMGVENIPVTHRLTLDEVIMKYDTKLRELKDRIVTLESENARLSAGKTLTKPVEDPSYHGTVRGVNENAYRQDINKFR